MNTSELKQYAFENAKLFHDSKHCRIDLAENAIQAFEEYCSKVNGDTEIYSCYLLLLELTYQYTKAKQILESILFHTNLRKLALQHLSSPVYIIEGLQSRDECIRYKKELIDIVKDVNEKKRLLDELERI